MATWFALRRLDYFFLGRNIVTIRLAIIKKKSSVFIVSMFSIEFFNVILNVTLSKVLSSKNVCVL